MPCKIVALKSSNAKAHIGDCINVYPMEKGLGSSPRIEQVFDIVSVTNADYNNPIILALLEPWLIANPAYILGDLTQPEMIEHPLYNNKFYLDIPKNISRPLTLAALQLYIKERF